MLAHECGHGAFSSHEWVNDLVGFVCHSYLLVPYFSWKTTHAKHHSKAANIGADTVFVPRFKRENEEYVSPRSFFFFLFCSLLCSPSFPGTRKQPIILTLIKIIITLTAGWYLYLFFNQSGASRRSWPRPNHFNPYSTLFPAKLRHLVILSDAGLLVCVGMLGFFAWSYGFWWLVVVHLIPYFHMNCWYASWSYPQKLTFSLSPSLSLSLFSFLSNRLVLITRTQHTDLKVPHFRSEDWNWLQGALATVDRFFFFFF